MTASDDVLAGWTRAPFTGAGITHEVLYRGSGPGVVLVPEIPGATPAVMALANRLVAAGFRVAVPSVIGVPGRPPTGVALAGAIGRLCVSREFAAFSRRADRPVAAFLRDLARALHEECGGPGVGVIGMCFSGGFALAAAAEPAVLAPVLSQPAMPAPIGAGRAATGLSPNEAGIVADRARSDGLCALGLRFTADRGVPAERFAAMERLLGRGWRAFEIDSEPGNPHGIDPRSHSVLTDPSAEVPGHPTQLANDAVVAFLRERLMSGS
ncbi:dienelactone hydrolase family protein [Actinotalea sp. M2MS4P-6]|uniref:dienelactone hydrolase family protein n=1 Tax=Actinotalea sp. M2MS4P-6 TaxID=2983762 RepID=UPI0021E4BCEB|nr:dienelactone hydrolase family protein [Actinotalea sp. M2MS4P-6]MCV2392910.1 dienelactone hydrolase family protein [Actinotalea sp. M2MS4P-6]